MIQKDVLPSTMYIYTNAIQCFQTTGAVQRQQRNTVRRRAFPVISSGCHCSRPSTTRAPSSIKGLGPRTQKEPRLSGHHHAPHTQAIAAIIRHGFLYR